MMKKAMSPLLATVLIIAAIVAVGALLTTFTASLGECGKVFIAFATVGEVPKVCFNQDTSVIEATIENGPKENVPEFAITLQGSRDLENSRLKENFGKSVTKKITIPYDIAKMGKLEKLKIVPIIFKENEEIICPVSKNIVAENVKEC
ncbi:hypothetical protein HZA96_06240 [Candidatus Woesearchaeota archaeon]|nr:hypothetical protein [Candidatus Woesearchaeota archaeon]